MYSKVAWPYTGSAADQHQLVAAKNEVQFARVYWRGLFELLSLEGLLACVPSKIYCGVALAASIPWQFPGTS